MPKGYTRLTWRERAKIEDWLKVGLKPCEIARRLGRHHTTIYREIKRGWGQQRTTELVDYECYLADIGQMRYEATFSGKGPALKIGHDHEFANYLGKMLHRGHRSPEAALGEIRRLGLKFKTTISPRTLYRYVEMGIIPGITNKDLPIKRKSKKKKRAVKRASRSAPGLSIEQRPQEINERTEFGHWEGDTVESGEGHRARVLKFTERVTRDEILIKVPSGEAKHVVRALDRLERQYGDAFYTLFKSITLDNGSEFADCAGMERSCRRKGRKRTTIYYCHPYSSWEKGTAEKQNGMIRRRYQKGTDFGKVSKKELLALQEWINNYPRKSFGFYSSAALREAHLNSLKK